MGEILFIAWVVAIGSVALTPLSERVRTAAHVVLSLSVGLTVYALSGLLLISLRMPFSTAAALWLASVSVALVLSVLAIRRRLIPSTQLIRVAIQPVAVAIGAYGALAALIQFVPATRLTTDSLRYLISAAALERTGDLAAVDPFDLRMRQLLTPMLHTWGSNTGRGYVAAVTPLITLSGVCTFAWLSSVAFRMLDTPRRWRFILAGGMVGLLLSTNRFIFHTFYINGHMLFATLLIAAIGLAWLAGVRRDTAYLWYAGLMLAALVPLRPEAVPTIIAFVIPLVVPGRLPGRSIMVLGAPFVVTAIVWNGLTYPFYARPEDLGLLGPAIGPAVLAGAFAAAVLVVQTRVAAHLARRAPNLALIAVATFVGVALVGDPSLVVTTVRVSILNMARYGLWDMLWWVMVPLTIGAILLARFPLQRIWTESIPIFSLLFLAFAVLRGSSYRIGWSDSGSRMLIHILLVLATYLTISAAALIRPQPAEDGLIIDLTDRGLRDLEREDEPIATDDAAHTSRQAEPIGAPRA